jgi:hypothetical protein
MKKLIEVVRNLHATRWNPPRLSWNLLDFCLVTPRIEWGSWSSWSSCKLVGKSTVCTANLITYVNSRSALLIINSPQLYIEALVCSCLLLDRSLPGEGKVPWNKHQSINQSITKIIVSADMALVSHKNWCRPLRIQNLMRPDSTGAADGKIYFV